MAIVFSFNEIYDKVNNAPFGFFIFCAFAGISSVFLATFKDSFIIL
jgi:hypothetical protein